MKSVDTPTASASTGGGGSGAGLLPWRGRLSSAIAGRLTRAGSGAREEIDEEKRPEEVLGNGGMIAGAAAGEGGVTDADGGEEEKA